MTKKKTLECGMCEGKGQVLMSCCGYNIHGHDSDLCPDCKEHCGDQTEDCFDCDGTGSFEMPQSQFEHLIQCGIKFKEIKSNHFNN